MAKPLTPASIKALKPIVDPVTGKLKPKDLFDGGGGKATKGLLVRAQPGGNKHFYAQFRRKSYVKKRATDEEVLETNSTRIKLGSAENISLSKARQRAGIVARAASDVKNELYGDDVRQFILKKLHGLDGTPIEMQGEAAKRRNCPTVAEFIDGYYAEHMQTEGVKIFQDDKEIQRLKYVLKVLSLPPKKGPNQGKKGNPDLNLLNMKLYEIDRALTMKWKAARLKRASDRTGKPPSRVTVQRELMMMRGVFNEAVNCNHIDTNPFLAPSNLGRRNRKSKAIKSQEREGLLTDNQEQCLLTALQDRETRIRGESEAAGNPIPQDKFADFLRPIILIAMNTGLRFGEITSLKWGDVSLSKDGSGKNQLVIWDTKNDNTLRMPLNTEAAQVLRKWKTWPGKPVPSIDPNVYVFTDRFGKKLVDIRRFWLPVFQDAGLPKGYRFHDLRHHFASKLVSKGMPLFAVQVLLNHSSPTMTKRYAHHAPEFLESVVESLVKGEA